MSQPLGVVEAKFSDIVYTSKDKYTPKDKQRKKASQ